MPRIARIANFDDLDPLRLEPEIDLVIVEPGEVIPGDAHLILLPGSKATIADLDHLRAEGWDIDIKAHWRRGGRVLGLCGGYQMLGRSISDPEGIEGRPGTHEGLGLLDVETHLTPAKKTLPASGTHVPSGEAVKGYEIHIGTTDGPDRARPYLHLEDGPDGAISPDGLVIGSYVHGIFAEDGFRAAFLAAMSARSNLAYGTRVEATLDGLASHLEQHADLDAILAIASAALALRK